MDYGQWRPCRQPSSPSTVFNSHARSGSRSVSGSAASRLKRPVRRTLTSCVPKLVVTRVDRHQIRPKVHRGDRGRPTVIGAMPGYIIFIHRLYIRLCPSGPPLVPADSVAVPHEFTVSARCFPTEFSVETPLCLPLLWEPSLESSSGRVPGPHGLGASVTATLANAYPGIVRLVRGAGRVGGPRYVPTTFLTMFPRPRHPSMQDEQDSSAKGGVEQDRGH